VLHAIRFIGMKVWSGEAANKDGNIDRPFQRLVQADAETYAGVFTDMLDYYSHAGTHSRAAADGEYGVAPDPP